MSSNRPYREASVCEAIFQFLAYNILLIGYLTFQIMLYGENALFEIEQIFKNFLGFMGVLLIVRILLNTHIRKFSAVEIGLNDLKPKMILTEKSIKQFKLNGLGTFYPDGLTATQVDEIKNRFKLDSEQKKIEIYKTFPLAPFIFFGVIFTLLFRDLFIKFIMAISY